MINLDWTKWVEIVGGLSLFILNLIINNRLMNMQLKFERDMNILKDSIQANINATMMPRSECISIFSDMTRRMDSIDKHVENTDTIVNSLRK